MPFYTVLFPQAIQRQAQSLPALSLPSFAYRHCCSFPHRIARTCRCPPCEYGIFHCRTGITHTGSHCAHLSPRPPLWMRRPPLWSRQQPHRPLWPTVSLSATPVQGPTPDGITRTLRVPILMYHYVGDVPADASDVRRDLTVTPANFEAQLQYLAAQGYHTISLYDSAGCPTNRAAVTGQAGSFSPLTMAIATPTKLTFPLLRQYGFTATFFVITDSIDQQDSTYLSWDQVVAMSSGGDGH